MERVARPHRREIRAVSPQRRTPIDTLNADISGRVGPFELNLSLHLQGRPLALIGPNGAGKTTCLKMLLGIYRPSAGRIEVGRRVLFDAQQSVDLAPEDRRLGYMPQNYGLFDHMSVTGNIAFGMNSLGKSKVEIAHRVQQLLAELDISHLAERAPASLSGGEKQRVALARALAIDPCALLLDEPLAALDRGARRRTRDYLREYLGQLNLPTLIVTHDPADVHALCDRVVAIERGAQVQCGSVEQFRRAPKTPFLQDFFCPDL
ncbi:sulfate/molybdate ABC transporter ATP-binding protein [Bradymonas sediminis]|uniref:sulfate/molybdate ABC transporter ATP-binding protein n=1 Tax=Bradymonas sediminis TaxID=1548548 RepID=UPI0023EA5E25|nr:ATP-binding cassette domain-containing protein [Bradymonas sediminis]